MNNVKIKYINNFVDNISTISPIIKSIINFTFNKALLITITFFIITITTYNISPVLFEYVLSYIDNSDNYDSLKEINNKDNEILELKKEIEILEKKKVELVNELSKSVSEKEGFIKGIKKAMNNEIKWGNVILAIGGVVFVVGGVYYFLFSGSDGSFFRPVLSAIQLGFNNSNDNTTKLVNNLTTQINSLNIRIEDLELQIKIIVNQLSN